MRPAADRPFPNILGCMQKIGIDFMLQLGVSSTLHLAMLLVSQARMANRHCLLSNDADTVNSQQFSAARKAC
jgi:hypothetical protein